VDFTSTSGYLNLYDFAILKLRTLISIPCQRFLKHQLFQNLPLESQSYHDGKHEEDFLVWQETIKSSMSSGIRTESSFLYRILSKTVNLRAQNPNLVESGKFKSMISNYDGTMIMAQPEGQ
jgi:hypothetical protein